MVLDSVFFFLTLRTRKSQVFFIPEVSGGTIKSWDPVKIPTLALVGNINSKGDQQALR